LRVCSLNNKIFTCQYPLHQAISLLASIITTYLPVSTVFSNLFPCQFSTKQHIKLLPCYFPS
jgi:hypothetical protein